MEFTSTQFPNGINPRLLMESFSQALPSVSLSLTSDVESGIVKSVRLIRADGESFTEEQTTVINEVVATHNPTQKSLAQQEEEKGLANRERAIEAVRQLLAGVQNETARETAFALVARSYAMALNEQQSVINSITDRATASAYISGTTWWSSMTAAQKQLKSLDLEAEAIRMQALILLAR